jgi:hypothetical protein
MNITNRTAKQFRESLDFLTTSYGEGDVPVGSRKLPSELALAVMTNKERLDSILGQKPRVASQLSSLMLLVKSLN